MTPEREAALVELECAVIHHLHGANPDPELRGAIIVAQESRSDAEVP